MKELDHFQEWIHPYLDGELEQDQGNALREHLGQCERCLSEYRAMKLLTDRLQKMEHAPDMPPEARTRILSSLPNATSWPLFRLVPRTVLAVAAIVLLTLGLSFFVSHLPPKPQVTKGPDSSDVLALNSMRSHHQLIDGNLPLELVTSDPQTVANYFLRSQELNFKGMFPRKPVSGVLLVGGRLHWLSGKRSAYLVFKHGTQEISLQIIDGRDVFLPKEKKIFRGSRVLVCTTRNCCHCISWKDSGTNTACFMISHLPETEMLDLAAMLGP